MVRGIDAAAQGMSSILAWNDVLANNLANVNTPGFKQSIATFKNFQDVIVDKLDATKGYDKNSAPLGTLSAGSELDSTVLDFKQGGVKTTGNPLDLAISGKGFFVVQTPNGEAYTRNGNFIRREDGVVSTVEGYPLLGEKGPITLDFKNSSIKSLEIDAQGGIRLNKQLVDKVRVVDFKDQKSLQAMGNSLLKPAAQNNQPIKAEKFEVTQGALESSNASVIESMVNSINGMRVYETLAKVVETNNKSLGKAVNDVGRMKR